MIEHKYWVEGHRVEHSTQIFALNVRSHFGFGSEVVIGLKVRRNPPQYSILGSRFDHEPAVGFESACACCFTGPNVLEMRSRRVCVPPNRAVASWLRSEGG